MAPLSIVNGTLGWHGTPVGKHWFKVLSVLNFATVHFRHLLFLAKILNIFESAVTMPDIYINFLLAGVNSSTG